MPTFTGTQNADTLNGTDGADAIFGLGGNDVINGGGGGDSMQGGLGDDIYYVDHSGDTVSEYEGEGLDTILTATATRYLSAHVENMTYMGTERFTGIGNALANTIQGGANADEIDGGEGADTMIGRGGDDGYKVDRADDVVIEYAGEGIDTVMARSAAYTLSDHVERLLYYGDAGTNFVGTGNSGNNEIFTGMGNDHLIGGAGADLLSGAGGDDTYDVDNVNDTVVEHAGAGIDRVNTSLATYTLAANVEQVKFTGAAGIAFRVVGNDLDNYVEGGSGNDDIDGGLGADTMVGLGGDDEYWVDNAGDQVVEIAGGGRDVVYTTLAAYILPPNVEALEYDGESDAGFRGTGNALKNSLYGSNGNDVLDGGAGADYMDGGAGDDTYIVDDIGDNAWEDAGRGRNDTVLTTLHSYTLSDEIENLRYIGTAGVSFHGVGNWQDNIIETGSGWDTLHGGEGADRLIGGDGHDTYWVDDAGDAVVEEAGHGTDTVRVTTLSGYTLGANVENLIALTAGNFHATGNALANSITTAGGDDLLNGGLGADTMEGGAGNDVYQVDDAGDVIVEKAGEGIDWVNSTLQAYTLGANVDNFLYSGVYDGDVTITGNALANTLHTGEGDDVIDGGAGADHMTGRTGNDIYHVDDLGDVVVEYVFGGTDEIRTALGSRSDFANMYRLPENIENLTGTSSSAQGVYGNGLDNMVKMGAGGDLIVLDGGGNDTVQSGGGNDFIYFGNAFTQLDSVDGGAGSDTLGLLGHYQLTLGAGSMVGIEKLAMYGSGSPYGFGYHYDVTTVDANVAAGKQLMVVAQSLSAVETLTFNGAAEKDGSFNVRGGKGADTISGGAGSDIIWGNLGADALTGGGGNDLFQYRSAAESAGQAYDRILDFGAGDKIDLKAIDADGNPANGNGKFTFIGNAAFSNTAGQLRVTDIDGSLFVQGDINGDGWADLQIMVTVSPGHVLGASDFVL